MKTRCFGERGFILGIDYNNYLDLHLDTRPDLSQYLYHFTRRTDDCDAFLNLIMLLESGVIRGSNQEGFVRGSSRATCFIDIPDEALPQYFKNEKHVPLYKRHEPYGIRTSKRFAFKRGARPVIYLPEDEMRDVVKQKDYWRVVRLDLSDPDDCVCFLHEREWRCKGAFRLATNFVAIFVKTKREEREIRRRIRKGGFPADKYSVISLEEIMSGLG